MEHTTKVKKLVILFFCLLVIGAGIWFFGLFPVSRVNGEYLLYRIYNERAKALEQFEVKNRLVTGGALLTQTEKEAISKSILQNLIMERVFWQYTQEHTALSGLKESADAVVASTLKEADPNILPQATKELYGWSVDEFVENVLFPQAFQNELREAIEVDGALFDEFARAQLNSAEVRLYAVPWKWENGGLVSK
ncbi:MAG: hypothetical protein A3J54_00175 [Candidatus Ryanbacteria bacterium RIFCSPHIGHO2_02_FULL_45_13b]|uniref:PpiC domain-containing protein n=1 Tax=Candidatus Ryanbacteria bacterium RIFCSPHIGHO2_02_FULL_45_13b TaxID=1802117 RepID=A0A1G2G9D5_9BACT|nr:MAG: hypothetical protein A3J54_00175 [Candidatus Ryanbacteria bacterium RIFCSPHIGHO2_02_FULL_45_13b]